MKNNEHIKEMDLSQIDEFSFKRRCVGCIVLTQSGKILLQHRDNNIPSFPDCLATFGGGIETNESPQQALIRELNEELGGIVEPSDVIYLGAITEVVTDFQDLIYGYFWYDRLGTITGCYEGQARFFSDRHSIVIYPKVMNDVLWFMQQCGEKKLLPF